MNSVLFLVQNVDGSKRTDVMENPTEAQVEDMIAVITEDVVDRRIQSFVVDATNWKRDYESTASDTA